MIRGADLETTNPFSDLTSHDRDVFASIAEEVRTEEPTIIIEEGEEAAALYVLVEGRVEVFKHGPRGAPQVLAVYGPGALFGEVSLFDPGARSATVKTRGRARLARFSYDEMERLAESDPSIGYRFLKGILRILSARLRVAGETIRDQLVWTLGPVVR